MEEETFWYKLLESETQCIKDTALMRRETEDRVGSVEEDMRGYHFFDNSVGEKVSNDIQP